MLLNFAGHHNVNNKRNRSRRKGVVEPMKPSPEELVYQAPDLTSYVDSAQIEIIDDKNFNIIADLPVIEPDSAIYTDFSSPLINPTYSQISIPLPEDDISNYILSNIGWDDSQFDILDSLLESL